MTDRPVILCEPQCRGFEHALFNAAFLDTVLCAYPRSPVIFLGEEGHLEWVRQILERHDSRFVSRVTWQAMAIPPQHSAGWRRLPEERAWCRRLFDASAAHSPLFMGVCSITPTGLFALKLDLYKRRTNVPTLVVVHSILASILDRPPRKPWNWISSLRKVLEMPHPRSLKYVALGEPILRTLLRERRRLGRHFCALDIPYFEEAAPPATPSGKIRFGHLGVGNRHKGFDRFAQLARETQAWAKGVEFSLVGFVDDAECMSYVQWIADVGDRPLSPEVYSDRAARLTYAVWLADPRHYRLAASASFLDALSYGKPGIYLRNPYVEHYFERMGDIGYLCRDYGEVGQVVSSIARDFPAERYRKQCENILQGRRIFEPAGLAPSLQAIVDGMGG
mgnify:CR=1 FL=1